MVRIEAVLRFKLVLAALGGAALVAGCVDQNIPVGSRVSSSSGRGNPSDSGTTGASSSAGTTSGGLTSASGTSGTTSGTGTGTTAGSSTGGGDTSSSSTSGTSSGGTSVLGPYVGFDAGPPWEPTVDLDAGCTAARPLDDPRSSRCVECLQTSDCPFGLVCDTSVDSCQACSSADNSGCGPGEVCARLGVSYDIAGYSGCVPNCLDAGPGLCDPGFCLFTGLCSGQSCLIDSNCRVDGGGGVCDRANGYKCVACFSDGGGCPQPGDLCNTQLGFAYCQQPCNKAPQNCHKGTFCTLSGLCAKGCADASDCSAPTTVCSPTLNACVECVTAADCPAYAPGCGANELCGTCSQDSDCGYLHCDAGHCTCYSDSECAANESTTPGAPTAPTCIGLDGGIVGWPVCGCISSDVCKPNSVCEGRSPYSRVVSSDDGKTFGGVCIGICNMRGGTNCRTAGITGGPNAPVPDLICEAVTGYCVQCIIGDCFLAEAPSCLRFGNGGLNNVEFGGQPTATGGGICGCPDTSSCSNNEACGSVPGWSGPECQTACSISGGPDACTSGGYTAQSRPFCDTWTGLCRACLSDYSCTGTDSSWNGAATTACELDSGSCVQCTDPSGCPGNLPGCSSAPETFGSCGFCATAGDCPVDAAATSACKSHSAGPSRSSSA